MQPSSLIFVVLIAIWAAYLLQHWVRRREHLATARSVDRFSEAMRVLQRRSAVAQSSQSSGAAPEARSYSLSPARPSLPEVVVKRVRPMRSEEVPVAPVRPTRIFHLLAGISARRLRGLSLLVSLSLMLVVSLLVAFSVLPWWNVLIAVTVLTADLAWLRRIAVSERSDRSPARAGESAVGPARPTAAPFGYFDVDSEGEAEVDADAEAEAEAEGGPGIAGREPEPQMESGAVTTAVVVDEAELAMLVEPAVEVDPSAWSPVPVPVPTYTLKAKAADPVPVPAAVIEHVAGEPWSLEGMVYDCDLDELVERRSASGA